jgi:hypothetical protein
MAKTSIAPEQRRLPQSRIWGRLGHGRATAVGFRLPLAGASRSSHSETPRWATNQHSGLAALSARCRADGPSAENARLPESGSADVILDVCDAGRVDRADLLERERPAVEPLE